MLNELDKLINFIQTEYFNFTQKWESSNYNSKINLKNNLVCDLPENQLLLNEIVNYRDFINQNNIQLLLNLKHFNSTNIKINNRTKAKNSIEFKIENYIQNHEQGKIPISKCFNDLFGIRAILNIELNYNEILNLIIAKYKNIKCI